MKTRRKKNKTKHKARVRAVSKQMAHEREQQERKLAREARECSGETSEDTQRVNAAPSSPRPSEGLRGSDQGQAPERVYNLSPGGGSEEGRAPTSPRQWPSPEAPASAVLDAAPELTLECVVIRVGDHEQRAYVRWTVAANGVAITEPARKPEAMRLLKFYRASPTRLREQIARNEGGVAANDGRRMG